MLSSIFNSLSGRSSSARSAGFGRKGWSALALATAPTLFASITAFAQPASPVRVRGTEVLQRLADDHQICILLGEGFANRIVETDNLDEGPVSNQEPGMTIRGSQRTTATTSFDAVPDPRAAKFEILLNGQTLHHTVVTTPQATVHLDGASQFQLSKQVEFDGRMLTTRSPSAYLTTNQRPVGAMTAVSGIPILGRIATNTVLNAVEQRRPSTDWLTAMRITSHVGPRFNNELDQQLSKINDRLSSFKRLLAMKGLDPEIVRASSTDDAVLWAASFRSTLSTPTFAPVQDAWPVPADPFQGKPVVPVPDLAAKSRRTPWQAASLSSADVSVSDQLIVSIHESLLDDVLSRFSLAGREISDASLGKLLQGDLSGGLNEPPQMATLILDSERPFSLSFYGNEILLEIRLAVRLTVGKEMPPQIITLSIVPVLTGDNVEIRPTLKSIKPVNPDNVVTMAALVEPVLKQKITESLKNVTLPATFSLPPKGNQPPVVIRTYSVSMREGRLNVILEAAPKASNVVGIPGIYDPK
ncbi:hypothetical protein [Planctomicrobium sp. SH664]|uniref:hypothetical protein n=1 Tax=Planctomicrobium sp. SH664 TaxID=3448125 RepID=UPI003F5B4473